VVDERGQSAGIVTSTDYLKLYANASRHEGSV
jgi:CBS-domain-containing membrane protein